MNKKILLLFAVAFIGMSALAQGGVTYIVTVPSGTNACYIAGEMNGWTFTEMTKVDENHYTVTIAEANTSHKYKYCSGPSWIYVEKDAGGGEIGNRNYSENDVVASWLAIYDPSTLPQNYVYNVEVPAGTHICYIAGNFNGWKHQKMNRVDDIHFTITINTTVPNGYKFCSGPEWDYVELQADCSSDVADRNYSINNVVACWKSVYEPIPIKIKVKSQWENTYMHIWDGDRDITTWPGFFMNKAGDISYYTIMDEPKISILFHNNSGVKTADILNVTESSCYKVENDGTYVQEDCSTYVFAEINETLKPSILVKCELSHINIQLTGDAFFTLYNMQGALIRQAQFTDSYTIDNLQQGLYLLKINDEIFKTVVK